MSNESFETFEHEMEMCVKRIEGCIRSYHHVDGDEEVIRRAIRCLEDVSETAAHAENLFSALLGFIRRKDYYRANEVWVKDGE